MREPTAEGFLKNTENHKMTVLHHDGIYRHIRFRQPSNSNMWFDLTTWPNMLTISGDMGCWTFSRVEDMFTFFRSTPEDFTLSKLKINPSYWAEKLQHGTHGRSDAGKVWDSDSFRKHLLEQVASCGMEDGDAEAIAEALKEDVLSSDDEFYLISAALEFSCDLPSGGKFEFDSCDLPDGMVYAYHFLWCLYAIVWGIQQWDAADRAAAA